MTVDSTGYLAPFQPDFSLFQTYADRVDVIFWVADPENFEIVYVSPHAGAVLGYPLAEWHRPFFWRNHLHKEDVERVLARFQTAVSTNEPASFEYRLMTASGTPLWFRDRICMLTENGTHVLCGMMIDVTEFKTAVHHDTSTPGFARIFLEIVTLLSANLDIELCMPQVAQALCAALDVTAVTVLEWDGVWGPAKLLGHYQLPATVEADVILNIQIANLSNFLGWHDVPEPKLLSANAPNLRNWEKNHLQNKNAQSILYVPLLSQDNLLGCIEIIESRTLRHFSPSDIEFVQTIAQQTAIAQTRAQLFQAEARRRREAEILLDVTEFVSSSLDRDEILARVMEILRVYLYDAHNLSISLIMDDGLRLETILSWWANDAYALFRKGEKIYITETFTSQLALKGGESIVISDLKEIPFVNQFTANLMKQGLRSILCVPLKIHNRILGTLHVHYWEEPRHFLPEEIALVEGVANQAAIAIENARLFANERNQLNLSRTMQQVGALLTTSLQLNEVYDQIFDLLAQVVAYDSASLFLFSEGQDEFRLVSARGIDTHFLESGTLNLSLKSVDGKIDIKPGWTVIADVVGDGRWTFREDAPPIRSWIGALLLVKGNRVGLLCVDSYVPQHYSQEQGQMVAAFANQAAVAIENARLYDETMRQTKELSILNQVSQETAVSLNIDTFLQKITTIVGAELYSDIFGFVLVDEKSGKLYPHSSYLGFSDTLRERPIPFHNSIIGQVVLTGETYYAPNVLEDPYYFRDVADIRSQLAIPIKVNQDVIGVINIESTDRAAFSQRDIEFLTTLAANISAVLERAKLYDTLRIQAESLAEQVAMRTGELKIERDRLFAILESAGEGIILTDTDARILYANPAMERQSGYSRAELQLEDPRVLGSNLMPNALFNEMMHDPLKQARWVGELVNKHKDGYEYDVAVTVTPIANAKGQVTGYVSVQSDITRIKELERLKTEFIANVSHQLRTPLTNIKTYVSLLKRGKPEKFPRYFSVLHYEIDRLARLIQDLLDISRLDAEAPPVPEEPINFFEWWDMFWPSFFERAERDNRALFISTPDHVVSEAPGIYMESYQLDKVFSRLMENALTYSNPGGRVRVAVDFYDNNPNVLEVKICDDGPGISAEERPFVFDRFFRGAKVVEAGLPGNGLGLAIAQELLQQYGGDIILESELGVGSCFSLRLPLAKSASTKG